MDSSRHGNSYYHCGLSAQEKALLLASRRQEATDRERERLRVLSELGRDDDAWRVEMLHNSSQSSSLSKDRSAPPSSSPAAPSSSGLIRIPISDLVTDKQVAAATRIQTFYRARKALSGIRSIQAQYDDLRHDFVLPAKLDFVVDEQFVTIESPQPEEKICPSATDAVSGKKNEERQALARQIEDEARSLDERVTAVWESRHPLAATVSIGDGDEAEEPH